MIFDYNFSIQGKSHTGSGTPCQDSSGVRHLPDGWHIAAVADGVGSAKNSQEGSRIAINAALDFCEKYMPWDKDIICIKSMLRTAYNHAYGEVLKEAAKTGEPAESYDTTLSLAIYGGSRVVFAHSGDGAILGLNTFGDYVLLTEPQKGPDGVSVIPLRFGFRHWKIDSYDEDLAAVLLMTDGMLETLCPYLLKQRQDSKSPVYVPLASFFADPSGITQENQEEIKKDIGEFLAAAEGYDKEKFYARLSQIYSAHIPEQAAAEIEKIKKNDFPCRLMYGEQDDKSMAAIINTDMILDHCPAAHYADPDWKALQEEFNRKAYPSLYADKKEEKPEDSKEDKQAKPLKESAEDSSKDASENPAADSEENAKKDSSSEKKEEARFHAEKIKEENKLSDIQQNIKEIKDKAVKSVWKKIKAAPESIRKAAISAAKAAGEALEEIYACEEKKEETKDKPKDGK